VTHWQILNVIQGGAAWANGQVFVGDKVMAVNGSSVTGNTYGFQLLFISCISNHEFLYHCMKLKHNYARMMSRVMR
jgi:hypothetical protein